MTDAWRRGAARLCVLLPLALLLAGCDASDPGTDGEVGPAEVAKTNPMRVYMHYMPWYHSTAVSGYWGSHWRMANRNPDVVGEDGQREIASHYYPLIGPYDSRDEAVIEYHLLLMKYAGIDAVLVDWYGTHNAYDYPANLRNSNALIDRLDDVGIDFGIVYEEFTAGNAGTGEAAEIEAAQADLLYMEQEYFSRDDYVRVDDRPLLLTFGPRHFQRASQWDEIFAPLTSGVAFLPLWNHDHRVGDEADGEFSWIDFTPDLRELRGFYGRQDDLDVLVGSAYPRFHDFYEEGGWGQSYGRVASDGGETLRRTLELARDRGLTHLQLATWNDFGEGTVLEPTVEDGFGFLETIQDFTGVPYGLRELELVHAYYLQRQRAGGDADAREALDRAFALLVALRVDEAAAVLDGLPE